MATIQEKDFNTGPSMGNLSRNEIETICENAKQMRRQAERALRAEALKLAEFQRAAGELLDALRGRRIAREAHLAAVVLSSLLREHGLREGEIDHEALAKWRGLQ